MAVYGYIRVSTAEQADDDRSSLDTQRAKVRAAAVMADLGHSHEQILAHYFRGSALKTLY